MFGTQAMRLLRTKWKQATGLAQELFAMFQNDIPLEHNAPITIRYDGTDAPLNLDRGFSDGAVINFTGGSGDTPAGIRFDGGSMVIYGPNLTFEGVPEEEEEEEEAAPTTPTEEEDETPSASTYPGQVAGGTGTEYTVSLYLSGTSAGATEVTATALGVAETETVGAGTWVMVSAVPGEDDEVSYYFTPVVWGPDL